MYAIYSHAAYQKPTGKDKFVLNLQTTPPPPFQYNQQVIFNWNR